MKFIYFLVCFILIGSDYFYINNDFAKEPLLKWAYFLWVKMSLFFAFVAILKYEKGRTARFLIKTVSVFLFIRCVWQLFEYKHEAIANTPVVLFTLYAANVVALVKVIVGPKRSLNDKINNDGKVF